MKIMKIKMPREIGVRPSRYESFEGQKRILYGLECAQD
jgi:hypothetical protein